MNRKLLAFCDAPTCETGFARVAQNLLSRWHASGFFSEIWIWGIGYSGFPHSLPYRMCPACTPRFPQWYSEGNLNRFLASLDNPAVGDTAGGFTHAWLMHDTWQLAPIGKALRAKASENGVRTLLYYPVDASLESEWMDIVSSVDVPVAYCDFGMEATKSALRAGGSESNRCLKTIPKIRVLPHGVDTAVYRPLELLPGNHTRHEARKIMFGGTISENDFLICVVGQNQKRKGHHQALQVLKALKGLCPEMSPKMYLHMEVINHAEMLDLAAVASALGLVQNKDVFFASELLFRNGHPIASQQQLNGIYNTADLLLSTSYGEGWGLPLTEAMAAGLPVAGPCHSSIADILGAALPEHEQRGILFGTEGFEVLVADNSRLRPRTDIQSAALAIMRAWQTEREQPESPLSLSSYRARSRAWITQEEFSWDCIAEKWLTLFAGS